MINDRFVIKKNLGEGRSKVFLCSDIDNDNKEFAIKILNVKADKDEIRAFREEFFTLRKLSHPNIISAHEEGMVVKVTGDINEIVPGCKYITLDFFDGYEILNFPGLDKEETLKKIVTQVCSVLYYLHQSNYIYYDLKPQNILVGLINDEPVVKLIDMGLAHYSAATDVNLTRGTAEFIAPEILKREPHNHLVDLYSLGMLLYRIIYRKFPFNTSSELEIYKSHIEKEFDFPETQYSHQLISLIKKLLIKNPIERYSSSLQALNHLELNISPEIYKDFLPAKIFAGRSNIISDLNRKISDLANKEIILISGSEGSGKTSLAYELYLKYNDAVFISGQSGESGINFVLYLLKKIIYSEIVYSNLSKETLEIADNILAGNRNSDIDNLKSVFNRISLETNFLLIIDDFNLLDEFTIDLIKEFLPILQINNGKMILTENSDRPRASVFIYNFSEIKLTPFTETELSEYVDKTFVSFFPRDQLKNILLSHADLLPGSILNFIKDIILLEILRFTPEGPEIITDERTDKLIQGAQEEIFKIRLSLLNDEELLIAETIALFENSPEIKVLSEVTGVPGKKIIVDIGDMIQKNVLQQINIFDNPSFTSESLKKYVYSAITDKEQRHRDTASVILKNVKDFSKTELARQFELAKEYLLSYKIYMEEFDSAEKLAAFSYQKKILLHLQEFPLPDELKTDIDFLLCKTLHKLNDSRAALDLINKIINTINEEGKKDELLIIKGSSLISLGELEKGKKILLGLTDKIKDESKKQQLLVEIAYAEFDLGSYENAKKICNKIIVDENVSPENKGRCYNLLGLIDTYKNNDLDDALYNFEKALEMFASINLKLDVAKMEANIGNIYSMKEDYNNAKKHWDNSVQINLSVGNLDQEAKFLLNSGGLSFNKMDFKTAIEHYKRAFDIFTGLGNRQGKGLTLSNLGEVFLSKCEYQKAFESLNLAKDIFNQLFNKEEEAEVHFLLGKLFYIIGDIEYYKGILNDYNLILIENQLSERQKNNYSFIEFISQLGKKETKVFSNYYKDILNNFKEQNEGVFFAEGYAILCEQFIKNRHYEEAYAILNDSKFTKICNENYLYRAGLLYLQALLASECDKFEKLLPIDVLNEAYELIKNEYVTELTWKVLYALSMNYIHRGNLKKANEFLFYSNEVINFIAGNISSFEIKSRYLTKPERNTVIEKSKNLKYDS
jgi:serine/threonine protein kinase